MIFFLITLFSTSIIIWIFQAVNYLDIIIEDGRDYLVYIQYSLLNFPKIISKIFPFALFFSFFYILTKYEFNNELIIFWNFGVDKIQVTNFILRFSIIIMLIQLLLTLFIVPESQNLSRSLIRTSNVDFYESFVKPKKFNDNVKGLTIYAEEKDIDGNLKNLYLKKVENNNEFQITIAKKGEFKNLNNTQILVLYDGLTINKVNTNLTNFTFSKSDFNLSSLNTNVVIDDKIQETRTKNHIDCIKKYFKKDLTFDSKQKDYINYNCSKNTLDNLFQEMYKRVIVPLYLPVLILTSLFLLIFTKENKFYQKFRILIFLTGVTIIVLSETLLRFIKDNFFYNFKIILIPILLFLILYIVVRIMLRKNLGART